METLIIYALVPLAGLFLIAVAVIAMGIWAARPIN